MLHGARSAPARAIRLSLIVLPTLLLLASGANPTSSATGDILAGPFLAPNPTVSGRGMTFDGDHLWYTDRTTANLYKLTATGQLEATIPTSINFWALAWDGQQILGHARRQ